MPRPHTRGDASDEMQAEEIAPLVEEIDVACSSMVLLDRACEPFRFQLMTTNADRGSYETHEASQNDSVRFSGAHPAGHLARRKRIRCEYG
jgi:hypothetical protein